MIPRAPTLLLAANDRGDAEAEVTASNKADTGRDEPETVAAPLRRPSASRTASARNPAARVPARPTHIVHRVKPGETLFSIAQKYNTSVAAVRQNNQLRGNTIKVGQRLTILSKDAAKGSTQAD